MSSPNKNMIARKKELPLQDDSSNLFLQIMISIAVFLFGVTLAGVLSINSMLAAWNESILGSLTVQIMPINDVNQEQAAAETLAQQEKAVELLKSKPEVEKVTPLNNAQLQKLIQPWLKPGAEVDFLRWSEELAETAPQASLDNHKLWLNKLIKFADGLKVLALAVLTLVVLITSGAIFYCTQTSLGLHKYIIEILHLMGAKDTYVAQQYAKRTAWLGFLGGLYGLVLAIPTIFVIANLARQIEGGIISDARLNSADWTAILSLPLFSMLIAMSTAYYTVKKTLEKFM